MLINKKPEDKLTKTEDNLLVSFDISGIYYMVR